MPIIELVNVIDGCYGPYRGAGAPTANVTLLGKAPVGATYMDTTAGVLYCCTVSTASVITWVKAGLQS
jgi:hypothetical protein